MDNVVLATNNAHEAKEMLDQLEEASSEMGKLNKSKTQWMGKDPKAKDVLPGKECTHSGVKILGRVVTLGENSEKDLEVARKINSAH